MSVLKGGLVQAVYMRALRDYEEGLEEKKRSVGGGCWLC